MSKKYFAEYIPVEGEIKQGDYYIDNSLRKNTLTLCRATPSKDLLEDKNCWKVKLCLCSRDIKIGDKIKDENFPEQDAFYMDGLFLSMLERRNIKDQFYKVIGKISPDAIWVERDMEFDEDEIEKWITYNGQPLQYIEGHTNYDEGSLFVKIKCPTCKTFH